MRANGVMRRFNVGNSFGLAEARQRAEILRRQIKDGADPTEEWRVKRAQAVAEKKGDRHQRLVPRSKWKPNA
ncbi:hypothetical protein [Sphingobium nicotianae]|uniref:hypothetical protein n=1 Tax=Sphingobium nicotianae TaxID=2782607 RepID=UPI003D7DD709